MYPDPGILTYSRPAILFPPTSNLIPLSALTPKVILASTTVFSLMYASINDDS